MRLPGFEAEAAIYRSPRHYATLSESPWSASETAAQVVPSRCFTSPKDCSETCIGATDQGFYDWTVSLCAPDTECCPSPDNKSFTCCPMYLGEGCKDGACVNMSNCPGGLTFCNGACVNTNNDPNNCGGCFAHCSSGCCSNGACADLSNDKQNCGTCGHKCPQFIKGVGPAEVICVSGKCCPVGSANCNNTCVDLTTNLNNCGACGLQCSHGQHCISGFCTNVSIGGGCRTFTGNCTGLFGELQCLQPPGFGKPYCCPSGCQAFWKSCSDGPGSWGCQNCLLPFEQCEVIEPG
jgi:hypothetical protein